MSQNRITLLIIAFLMFLTACGPAETTPPDPVTEFIPHESEKGITLQVPNNWIVDENPDTLNLATSADLINAPTITGGSSVIISVSPAGFVTTGNLLELIGPAIASFAEQEGAEVLQEATTLTINEQTAAGARVRGPDQAGNEIVLRYTLIADNGQIVFVTAVTDASLADTYAPTIEAIINSIEVGPPPG